ncbi:MAG: aldo/keto reductase [Acidimicrobiia bacterium]|nr:aldo/keto reductase [Acidimicrobiia bacterium]
MSPIPHAPFGRSIHQSSRVIFGAAAFWAMPDEKAAAVLDNALAAGINHIDTAAAYGDSELRLAPWLKTHRQEVFLATKTGDRDGDGARRSLENSLERLGVDRVDLIQLHNLVEDQEWDRAFRPDGAVDALARAKEEGLAHFVGVTGHGLRIAGMHARSLERYDFDSVLLPYNFALLENPDYRRDVEALLQTCAQRHVAVQTIKGVARRRWREEDEGSPHFSWYEPLDDEGAISRAVRYVLSNEQLFLNTSSDVRLVQPTIEAASAHDATERPSDDEMQADMVAQGIEPLFDGAALERI